MRIVLLDPTNEMAPDVRTPIQKLASLEGQTVGLLDLSKPRSDVFLDRIDELLQLRGVRTRRYRKPTFTRTAPLDLLATIAAECDAVVEGLAD